jgi:SCF-associated factor 1
MLDKLPRGILLFDILELLDSESLIKLSFVSKYFNTLVNDESIWKKLCLQEFNISQDYAYRNKGWKTFYQALKYHARVYTWGENVDSRLGLDYPADSTNEQDADMVFQLPFRY